MTDSQIPDPELMTRLQLSVTGVKWAVSRVHAWQHEPFEGGWSAHQNLVHLLAVEKANYHVRIARVLEENTPELVAWDNDAAMAAEGGEGSDIEALAERFMAARTTTFEMLKDLSPEQWRRTAVWPDGTVVDLSWIAEKVLWHALDHFATLLDIHQEFEPIQAK